MTNRTVEDAAGATHGTLRHHFGDYSGYLTALVEHLVAVGVPAPGETPAAVIERWLGPQRLHTLARYELALISVREPALAQRFTAARDELTDLISRATGLPLKDSHDLMTSLDGLVMDALLRNDQRIDPSPVLRRFGVG